MRATPPISPVFLLLSTAALAALVVLWVAGRQAIEVARLPDLPRSPVVAAPAAPPPLIQDSAELARLREENARLRAQLDTTRSSLDQTASTLDRTTRELERLRRPLEIDMASATLRANLAPGEGVVTGGYRLPDGNRLFAFVETDALPDGGIGVMSRLFSVPDDITRTLGLETLATEAANTLQHGEVWVREELTEVAGKLENTPSARILTAGVTTIRPGDPAACDVPLSAEPGAPPLSLNVNATYDAARNLDLELRIESLPVPEAPPPAPATPTPTE